MKKEIKKHRGKIVQKTIIKLGLKIKEVAKQLGVSRGTLYNYFAQADLDDYVLLELGRILRHDFTVTFPELIPLKKELEEKEGFDVYGRRTTEELSEIQRKYYKLLEKHNFLLKFLLKVAVDYDLPELKEEIIRFKDRHLTQEEIDLGAKIEERRRRLR